MSFDVPAESRTAVMTGVMDASWLPDNLMAQGILDNSLRAIFWAYELVKDWEELAVIAKPDFIKSNPDVLKRFLRASQKTREWTSNNLDEAANIWTQAVKLELPVATQLLKAAPKEVFTTKLSPVGLKVADESVLEFKQIERAVPWKELMDQSLLPPELRAELPS